MRRVFWLDGRFSWPLVIAVAFASLSLVLIDYAWRVLILPFETLLLYAVAIDAVFALLMIAIYFVFLRRRRLP